jgi:hypothetical protein
MISRSTTEFIFAQIAAGAPDLAWAISSSISLSSVGRSVSGA